MLTCSGVYLQPSQARVDCRHLETFRYHRMVAQMPCQKDDAVTLGKISPWLYRELETTERQGHLMWPLYECSLTSAEQRDGVLGSSLMLYTPSLHTGTPNQRAEGVEKDVVDPSAGVDHHATQNRGVCRRLNPGIQFQNAAHPRSGLDCSRSDRRSNEDNRAHVQHSEFCLSVH